MAHRVLYVSESVTFGGAEQYLAILWGRLDRDRYTPMLYCHPETPSRLVELARERDVAMRPVSPIRGKWDLPGMIRQRRLFREAKADLIHFNLFNPYQGQYGILAARGAARLAATYHLPPRSRTASAGGRLLERAVTGSLDRIIAVCRASADLLVAHFGAPPGRMAVVHNGIEPERCEPGSGVAHEAMEGRSVVIAVGRLTPQKGFDTLIRAAPEVLRSVPEAGFLIVGDGPLRPELDRAARDSGAREAITFAGDRRDIRDLILGARVLALPSAYEGLPLVVLEAMACGRPVVASSVDGVPEAVRDGETGILVPSGDAGRLASALIDLLRDPGRAEEMGRRGRERAHSLFSASRMTEGTEQVYEDCLQGS